jgi:hypothetical protein
LRNGDALPVTSARGRTLGETAELAGLKIAPTTSNVVPQRVSEARFGGFAALRGYDLSTAGAVSGETITLALHWEALAPVDTDYTVFIHLMDADGRPIAQADGQPLGGAYPTTLWERGEWIVDRRTIALGSDILSSDYRLGVGWHLLESGERVPASDVTGKRLTNDMVILESVRVEQGDDP